MFVSFWGYVDFNAKADPSSLMQLPASEESFFTMTHEDMHFMVAAEGPSDASIADYFEENEHHLVVKNGYSDQAIDSHLDLGIFSGEGVFLTIDKKNKVLRIFSDPIGSRPLYYIEDDCFFAFSTEIDRLFILLAEREMDPTWIADALIGGKSEAWRTPYCTIKRIQAAEHIQCTHRVSKTNYFPFENREKDSYLSFQDSALKMKNLLYSAVEKMIRKSGKVGVELSGGMDSSAITSILAQEQNSNFSLFAFSHVFSKESRDKFFPFEDEYPFIKEIVKFSEIEQIEFCDGDNVGIVEMLKRNIEIHQGPTQQSFSMLSDVLYQRAQEQSVEVMFSGFGGDEGVSSRVQGYFESLSMSRRYRLLKLELSKYSGMKGGSWIRFAMKFMCISLTPRLYYFIRKSGRKAKFNIHSFALSKMFGEELPISRRMIVSKGLPQGFKIRERQIERLLHPHVSQRLEYSYIDAKVRGLEYRYPLLDRKLLSYYINLPLEYKFREGHDRALFREAMKGVIPESIRLRKDKSIAAIPTLHQRISNDLTLIEHIISDAEKENKFHYLDYEKLKVWLRKLVSNKRNDVLRHHPLAFLNSLQILLLQEMERTGEFKSGIKC